MGCCRDTVPIGSLCGAILQCVGVAMFCSSAILGFNEALTLFDDETLAKTNLDDILNKVEIGVYCWTAFMMVCAIVSLFNAFMVTAQTSSRNYEEGKICCSSPACVGLSVFFNAVILIIWIGIMILSTAPVTFSLIISAHPNISTETTTVDFSYYGFHEVSIVEVDDLEGISGQMILLFSLTLGGAVLVTLGTVETLACMTSNWVHRTVGDKWQKYANKRKQEERELNEMTSYKSSERLAQSLYY
ncbi:proteolipid protein DM beta-like [Diadema antillarum]|uniref:proteolipid protein DM beta-like n=1 Tax=Diadema antillarum TaxID=105358 RepID=UPI003A87C17D